MKEVEEMKKIIAMFTAILMMVSVFGTVSAFADNSIPTLGYTNVIAESNITAIADLADTATYSIKAVNGHTTDEFYGVVDLENHPKAVQMKSGVNIGTTEAPKYCDPFLRFAYTKINPSYDGAIVPDSATKAELNYIKLELDICFEDLLNGTIQIINHAGANDRDTYELLAFKNNGKAAFINGSAFDYDADTWYSVVVYMDLKENIYTAYVNNVLKQKDTKILQDSIVSSLGTANAFIGYGFALNGQETASKVYIDNMKYSAVEPPVNGGLFMTEMGSGNKRLNYFRKTGTELTKTTTNEIFNGKSIIENATSVDSNIWGKKSDNVYSFEDTEEKGNILNIKNNYTKEGTTTYTDSFIRPQYSYVTAANTLITDANERAKHQNVVVNFDAKVSAKNKFVIAMRAHNSSAGNKYAELINFDAAGKIKVGNSEVENVTYEPNVWYSFVLSMNFTEHNFDAYMVDENGVVTTLAQDASIDNSYLYGITYHIGFQSANTTDCTMSIDDLSYYTGSAALSTIAPYSNKKLIGASYNGGALASVETATIGSAEYDLASVGFASGADKYGMIWDSFGTMLPAIAKTPLN